LFWTKSLSIFENFLSKTIKKNFENLGQETFDFEHNMNQFKVQIHTFSSLGMENVILNTDTLNSIVNGISKYAKAKRTQQI